MKKHILNVESGSKAEDRLIGLLLATDNATKVDIERKETVDGTQYKEYRFNSDVFKDIQTYLNEEIV